MNAFYICIVVKLFFILLSNFDKINATNSTLFSEFGLMAYTELKLHKLGSYFVKEFFFQLQNKFSGKDDEFPDQFDIDEQVDWIGAIPENKNCNACTRIAAVSQYSWHYSMLTGVKIIFSPQEIVDCGTAETGGGCDDCSFPAVFSYMKSVKYMCLASQYPYVDQQSQCVRDRHPPPSSAKKYYLSDYYVEINADISTIKKLLMAIKGPIATGIHYSPEFEDEYHDLPSLLPYEGECSDSDPLHAVLLFGWRKIDGKTFWRFRNNNGANWGHGGEGLLAADFYGEGKCGILATAFYIQLDPSEGEL